MLLPFEIQELLSMRFIAERFGSAGARDGEGTSNISEFEAIFDLCSLNILMNKAGIKTVAGADSIDEGARYRWSRKNIAPTLRQSTLGTALDYNEWYYTG